MMDFEKLAEKALLLIKALESVQDYELAMRLNNSLNEIATNGKNKCCDKIETEKASMN